MNLNTRLTDGTVLTKQYVTAGEYWLKLLHASDPYLLYLIWLKCADPDAEIPEDAEQQMLERRYLGDDGVITKDFRALVLCTVSVAQDGEGAELSLQDPREKVQEP